MFTILDGFIVKNFSALALWDAVFYYSPCVAAEVGSVDYYCSLFDMLGEVASLADRHAGEAVSRMAGWDRGLNRNVAT